MSKSAVEEKVTILVAEDDDGHAELIIGYFRKSGLQNPIIRFVDGQHAMDFFVGPDFKKDRAYLLMLDIRMPKLDGVEVLRKMKADPSLRDIPIIMLTTTDDPREVETCYRLGCNFYVTKPVDFNDFAETLHRLGLFIMVARVSKVSDRL